MAISKLKPRHASEGRSIAAALKDRLDYDKNPEKTDGGLLVTGYQCSPDTAWQEFGELPNKRKGINFCQQPYKGRRAKGYPFPLLAKSFVICSRVPHLATFQKDSAFQKSTFLFRFVRDDTLNMNT